MPSVALLLMGAGLLLLLSLPIFLSLLLPTIIAFNVSGLGLSELVLAQRTVQGVNVYSLLAIPLFIFAADIIARGEIGSRLVAFADALVGHIPGGLAVATVLTMAVFGAISGIGAAAVVSVGPIVYPALLKQGYGRGFSVGLILAGSTLAMLVPPGVAMILYSIQTNASIADVFLAGLASGLVFVLLMSGYALLYAFRRGIGVTRKFSLTDAIAAFRVAGWALLLPVIILGGIYGGVFTATEAAAVSVVYAMVVEVGIYRRLGFRQLFGLTTSSAGTISMLLILIAAGSVMTWFLTVERVPQAVAELIGSGSPVVVLLVINVMFLMVGMLIDPNSAIIVLTPLIYPAAMAVGIEPVHLGAVVVLNLAIGMITPPFGLNLFIGMATFKVGYQEAVLSTLPFIGLALIALAITTYLPSLIMWLPDLSSVR